MVAKHDFVEVLTRRWCLTCNLFQTWKNGHWYPLRGDDCPSIYAPKQAKEESR